MTAPLRTKAAYYAAWRAGLLGNRPKTWTDAAALVASGHAGLVVARAVDATGWKTRYGITVREALALAADPAVPELTFNECMPDEQLLIQGEVMRSPRGLELFYTCAKKPMKQGFAEDAASADGLVAKMILDTFLWPSSRDDLDALLDLYDGHVVEFSTYRVAVGDQRHRNTIFWETRAY